MNKVQEVERASGKRLAKTDAQEAIEGRVSIMLFEAAKAGEPAEQ